MKKYKFLFYFIVSLVMLSGKDFFVNADTNSILSDTILSDTINLNEFDAKSVAVIESGTGTYLGGSNEKEIKNISHLAKLMTFYIAVEKIESGEFSIDDITTVSAHANSMNGTQIWLDTGEKVKIDDLLKSISIGNANDACVALAEKISGNEIEFCKVMNKKAEELNMHDTHFEDCTGISSKTVSTAYDMALLISELNEYENYKSYFTTWLDTVRDGKVELVSTNKLIRTYKGLCGFKACSSEKSGECIAVSAKKENMTICIVMLDCKNDDIKFNDCTKIFDKFFSCYEVFIPEIDAKIIENIKINRGEKNEAEVDIPDIHPVIIKKGEGKFVNFDYEREEKINAPCEKGQQIGNISLKIKDTEVENEKIILNEDVKEISFIFLFKKMLLNLLNL